MIAEDLIGRKGARKLTEIDNSVKVLLEQGVLETVNLTEWLSIDHKALCKNVFTSLNLEQFIAPCIEAINSIKKPSTIQIIAAVGKCLLEQNASKDYFNLFNSLKSHPSDSVRCWAAYMIGADEKYSFENKLKLINRFASDNHFGVREIAWMAVRESIAQNIKESVIVLSEWAFDRDPNIRRFASESTRPRGVWCKHIEILKEFPELGLPILQPLRSDSSLYVQNSVANWLNDAGKTRPEWVKDICKQWNLESMSIETKKITKRALRNL